DGLRSKLGCGSQLRRDHRRGGEQSNQAIEGQAMNSRDRAAGGGHPSHQVIGGLARRCDHQDFGGGLRTFEPFTRRCDSLGGAIGTDYLDRLRHLPWSRPAWNLGWKLAMAVREKIADSASFRRT